MKKRLFVAIELPPALHTELSYIIDQLKLFQSLKPVSRNQLHLTLAFLGDVDIARIPDIKKIIDKIASTTHPLPIGAQAPTIFINSANFRGIWIPVTLSPELSNLASILRAELTTAGLHPDQKPFAAHITLARARDRTELDKIQAYIKESGSSPFPGVTADSISLISSRLTPQGPIYSLEHKKTLD